MSLGRAWEGYVLGCWKEDESELRARRGVVVERSLRRGEREEAIRRDMLKGTVSWSVANEARSDRRPHQPESHRIITETSARRTRTHTRRSSSQSVDGFEDPLEDPAHDRPPALSSRQTIARDPPPLLLARSPPVDTLVSSPGQLTPFRPACQTLSHPLAARRTQTSLLSLLRLLPLHPETAHPLDPLPALSTPTPHPNLVQSALAQRQAVPVLHRLNDLIFSSPPTNPRKK